MSNIKIKSVANYEIGNGIEAVVLVDSKEYKVYLQLPQCADSQHCFLDNDIDNDDLLAEIACAVDESMSNLDLNLLTHIGHTSVQTEEYNDFYIVVDDSDDEKHFFKQSSYASYYNISVLFEQLDKSDEFNEELMTTLDRIADELIAA